MKITTSMLLAFAGMSLAAGSAYATPSNLPPPSGAILDLDGTPITNTDQVYSVNFSANVAATAITFAFRQDPAFVTFTNVSVVDLTNPGANLILNGDFSSGSGNNATNWTYANIYGAQAAGVVAGSGTCANGITSCWYDGAVQAYDAISQTIATNVGDTYKISFLLDGGGSQDGVYSALSTNGDVTDTGGNGIDVLAYAQAGLPVAGSTVPEPASWAMMLLGFAAVGYAMRMRPQLRSMKMGFQKA
jgi:hypothetical protein